VGGAENSNITVEALGDAGLDDLTRNKGWTLAVPRRAASAMPICRRGDGQVLVPDFGQSGAPFDTHSPRNGDPFDCSATFLWTHPSSCSDPKGRDAR
ncbi:MAG: hypothetical protein AAF405_02265, partial [Pseudomonadota bacterium]